MAASLGSVTGSLRAFKSRRDSLLHGDSATFEDDLHRFLTFCNSDPLVHAVVERLREPTSDVIEAWWEAASDSAQRTYFPDDADEDLALRFGVLQSASAKPGLLVGLGIAYNQGKQSGWIELFRNLVVQPFVEELSQRLASAADLATPEARAVQAVSLSRIPGPRVTKIFLSHKSADKALVLRFYSALATLGFDPWLDDPSMPAGVELEQTLIRGLSESCAAVFFITQSFRAERYIAAEIQQALQQKQKKKAKFAIVALRYSLDLPLPSDLSPYVYKDVGNDLEGFEAILKAIPIELGPLRWKAAVVDEP